MAAMKDVTPDVTSLTEHPTRYYFPYAFKGNRIKLVRDRSSKVAKRSQGKKLKCRFCRHGVIWTRRGKLEVCCACCQHTCLCCQYDRYCWGCYVLSSSSSSSHGLPSTRLLIILVHKTDTLTQLSEGEVHPCTGTKALYRLYGP
jgi:hypothetical protein